MFQRSIGSGVAFFIATSVMVQALAQSGTGINLRFERIGLAQGLSQKSGNWILQDKQGFIWIATSDGLNKFDGYNFVVYRHAPDDETRMIGRVADVNAPHGTCLRAMT